MILPLFYSGSPNNGSFQLAKELERWWRWRHCYWWWCGCDGDGNYNLRATTIVTVVSPNSAETDDENDDDDELFFPWSLKFLVKKRKEEETAKKRKKRRKKKRKQRGWFWRGNSEIWCASQTSLLLLDKLWLITNNRCILCSKLLRLMAAFY